MKAGVPLGMWTHLLGRAPERLETLQLLAPERMILATLKSAHIETGAPESHLD